MKIGTKITISFFIAGVVIAAVSAFLHKMYAHTAILLISMPLVAALIGFISSKIFFRTIRNLENGAKIISSGNLEYSVGIDSHDEIGELSRAFDKVTDGLRNANASLEMLKRESVAHEETIGDLNKREEHFRRLFEQSNDAVFIYDMGGKIIDVNNKATEMLSYPKEILLKIPFLELQTEEELTSSKRAKKTGDETTSVRFESKFVKSDGMVIDVGISSSCVDMKKGVMQALVTNITERKRLEKALRESEEKFRTFMETANDLMYIASKDGYFTYVNGAMCSTLGYYKEEMIGMHVTEVFNQESLGEYKENQKELIRGGAILYEPIWETKNRVKIYGEMRVSAIYDKDGEFDGSRGVLRDISERKKIEGSQRLAHLGKLAADVAHEVNNPVMVISGNAELALMEGVKDDKIKKTLNIIMEQCEQARSIIKRLLMFSKPSKGTFKEINIADAIDFVVSLVEPQFTRKKVRIIKKTGFSLPSVLVDEKQIQEVFMNLLRNAADAMPDGGSITITTSLEGSRVRIDFTDSGEGITEENMKLILDPFFTTKEHGTGLGLSVCYGILRSHGGDLRYTSEPGEGTTAIAILPATDGLEGMAGKE
ncbi:PAS domain S-box protein [Candidatus Omnitrophota bacterium]